MGTPALLLDIGGVVMRSSHEIMATLPDRRPELAAFARHRGRLGPEPDPAWEDALAGRGTERGYWAGRAREAAAVLGGPDDVRTFMTLLHAGDEDQFRPEAVALMDDARAAGTPVAALTNDLSAFYGDGDLTHHPVLARFDVIVDGSVTGVLKPDPRAYACALDALGRRGRAVPAGDVVYLDDMPVNLAAARDAGFRVVAVDVADPVPAFDAARALLRLTVGTAR